jgi:hypothetical protein
MAPLPEARVGSREKVQPASASSLAPAGHKFPDGIGRAAHPSMTTINARESLQLCLRLAAAPGNGAYKVTIELFEIDLVVESIDLDLRGAVRAAADRCAEQLRERGYSVTSADVIGALEDALEWSQATPKPQELLN